MAEKEYVKSQTDVLNRLSDREMDVLVLVGQLLSNKQIAEKLNISVRTVQKHRENISRKAGVTGRGGLDRWILSIGNEMSRI